MLVVQRCGARDADAPQDGWNPSMHPCRFLGARPWLQSERCAIAPAWPSLLPSLPLANIEHAARSKNTSVLLLLFPPLLLLLRRFLQSLANRRSIMSMHSTRHTPPSGQIRHRRQTTTPVRHLRDYRGSSQGWGGARASSAAGLHLAASLCQRAAGAAGLTPGQGHTHTHALPCLSLSLSPALAEKLDVLVARSCRSASQPYRVPR